MKLKVDLLIKSELLFELLGRNIQTISADSTVPDLRKLLRIHQDVPFDSKNLIGKIEMEDELSLIEEKLSTLETYIGELSSRAVTKILRAEAKLCHLELRCDTLIAFNTSEEVVRRCRELKKKMEELKEAVAAVGVDEAVKERVFRKMSEDIAEEQELDDVFLRVNQQGTQVVSTANSTAQAVQTTQASQFSPASRPMTSGNTVSTFSCNTLPIVSHVQSSSSGQTSLLHPREANTSNDNSVQHTSQDNLNLFAKLPNPIEKYLKMFKSTSGLNVGDLLEFIKICLKMSSELKLGCKLIMGLATNYCHGPLLCKMIELKDLDCSLDYVHGELLKSFVPINLRENLRKTYVNRPQRIGEPLSMYCHDIKEHAKVLLCSYSELELVQIIKLGISPQDRSRLVFMKDPVTFADLDELCIQSQNMAYSDHMRSNRGHEKSHATVHNVNNQNNMSRPNARVCYYCQRPGHIAKFCYKKNQRIKDSA